MPDSSYEAMMHSAQAQLYELRTLCRVLIDAHAAWVDSDGWDNTDYDDLANAIKAIKSIVTGKRE